ncbi:MAG: acyltransferase family protein [Lachnospiraceae bacterium]|nr:acyltransferase family protein [Lachnospiraceae bacterium]
MNQRSKHRLIVSGFSILVSLMVLTCITPSLKVLYSKTISEQSVSVQVIGAGEAGASELWIATDPMYYNLSTVLDREDNVINGSCEFRLAKDWGYGYDFLISYGENIGSEIHISYLPFGNPCLLFYRFAYAGKIRLSTDTQSETFSLYQDIPGILEYPLPVSWSTSVGFTFLRAVFFLLFFAISFFFLRKLEFKPVIENAARDPSLDLVRAVAAFLVVAVHSFLASGYYDLPLEAEWRTVILTALRWVCACCNCLFLLLTGSLCRKRDSFRKTVAALIPLFITFYAVIAIKVVLIDFAWKKSITALEVIRKIVSTEIQWYLQMYAGIALLTPFLNPYWNNSTMQRKILILLVLLCLVTLGGITGNFIPSYCMGIWPFVYYFIGAFLAEYRTEARKSWLVLLLLLLIGLETLYTITFANGNKFSWSLFGGGGNGENHALPLIASSMLLFILLKSIHLHNKWVIKTLRSVSSNAFGIYLFSVYITDGLVYPFFQRNYKDPLSFAKIQIIPLICSFCLAWVLSAFIYQPLSKWAKNTISRIAVFQQDTL